VLRIDRKYGATFKLLLVRSRSSLFYVFCLEIGRRLSMGLCGALVWRFQ
jgi:hypothetical protein